MTSIEQEDSGHATEIVEAPESQARRLRNGIVAAAVLVVLIIALLIAVPGLHGVGRVVTQMNIWWLVAAIALQLLSCVGYILVFLGVFERVSASFGARVALTELAFGAAVSLGGAGSLVVGGWLLRERGFRLGEVAERSAVLFLLTSAVNAVTLIAAGLLLGLGIVPGPTDPWLTLLPAGLVALILAGFMVLPPISDRFATQRGSGKRAALARATARTVRDTRKALLSPDWRLFGAFGYLWFNIAVLWACFEAAGHSRFLCADPGARDRHVRAVRREGHACCRSVGRLPRDHALAPARLGHGQLHSAAPRPQPEDRTSAAASPVVSGRGAAGSPAAIMRCS